MMKRLSTEPNDRPAAGFTLVELLVSISIIGILASMVLFAMAGAEEVAREDRTRAQIVKIDALLSEKWESYATRRLDVIVTEAVDRSGNIMPLSFRGVVSPADPRYPLHARYARVDGIRELMRIELPERKLDIFTPPRILRQYNNPSTNTLERPFLQRIYYQKAAELLGQRHGQPPSPSQWMAWWSNSHQGSECLYLILSQLYDGDANALEFFKENEIADTDSDGMPEILDAWGMPIEFLRWAPGFVTVGGGQDREAPDAFDPTNLYPDTFALYPLVFSAGPDRLYDVNVGLDLDFTVLTPPNNPYSGINTPGQAVGSLLDANRNGREDWRDNIHNHLLIAGN